MPGPPSTIFPSAFSFPIQFVAPLSDQKMPPRSKGLGGFEGFKVFTSGKKYQSALIIRGKPFPVNSTLFTVLCSYCKKPALLAEAQKTGF